MGRGGAGIFVMSDPKLAAPAMIMAICSYLVEAITIAWEVNSYNVPKDAAPPMTLMGLFSTWVMLIAHYNPKDYLFVPVNLMTTMYVLVGLIWGAWIWGVIGFARRS